MVGEISSSLLEKAFCLRLSIADFLKLYLNYYCPQQEGCSLDHLESVSLKDQLQLISI